MPLINWIPVELKLKWTNNCVLSAAGADKGNGFSNNIILTIKDIKLYLPEVTLSTKENQKLLKLFSKWFERTVYWNEYETKKEIKNATNEYRNCRGSKFVEVNRLLVLIYSNQDGNSKRYKVERYYLPKVIIENYNIIISGKNFYDQPIDFDIKRFEEIRKLASGLGEDYNTGCLLDYDYIKNHYGLITINLSRWKELDSDI